MRKKILALVLALTFAAAYMPSIARADEYDRDDDDMWLRYVAYVLHPVGIALEYFALRPIHWFVSQPDMQIWYGHEKTEDKTYNTFTWE